MVSKGAALLGEQRDARPRTPGSTVILYVLLLKCVNRSDYKLHLVLILIILQCNRYNINTLDLLVPLLQRFKPAITCTICTLVGSAWWMRRDVRKRDHKWIVATVQREKSLWLLLYVKAKPCFLPCQAVVCPMANNMVIENC